jgi:hypothetical protein
VSDAASSDSRYLSSASEQEIAVAGPSSHSSGGGRKSGSGKSSSSKGSSHGHGKHARSGKHGKHDKEKHSHKRRPVVGSEYIAFRELQVLVGADSLRRRGEPRQIYHLAFDLMYQKDPKAMAFVQLLTLVSEPFETYHEDGGTMQPSKYLLPCNLLWC